MKGLKGVPGGKTVLTHGLVVNDERLGVRLGSLKFPNPVGLGAGFDKFAEVVPLWPHLGFGFVELGTFTPLPQSGQDFPRLFRFPEEKAIINRMGFNNPGIKVAAKRIEHARGSAFPIPIGINIGKGKATPIEGAVHDYMDGFDTLFSVGDYFTVNVSSPNTPQLRELQQIRYLREILTAIKENNESMAAMRGWEPKPIFVKVSPDNSLSDLEEIVSLVMEFKGGVIATNTTVDHSMLKEKTPPEGGLSGRPLKKRANETLKRVFALTKGAVPIIGVGGVNSAEDAYEKIRLGASLIQVYTGWIFEGPDLVPNINRGLLRLMERDGFKSVKDAVGTLN